MITGSLRRLGAWRRDPRRAIDFLGDWVLLPLAARSRRRNRVTRFVAVTGSGGKTTTKELVSAVLATRLKGIVSTDTLNRAGEVARVLLATRRDHDYCAQELGTFGPGTLEPLLAAFRPDVGIVTHVARDHYRAFRTLEEVAREKGRLVEALPPTGTAILNGDDPLVAAMAERTRARVMLVGGGEDAHLRAEGAVSRWPDGLSFEVCRGTERHPVQTRLLGTHWQTAVLAALATGLVMGIPLEEGIRAVADLAPTPGRLSPMDVGSGILFIIDDWKGSTWTVPAALEVLSNARARRRLVVLGQLSDDPRKPRRLYRDVTRQALEVADRVLLVGRWARHGLLARRGRDDDRVMAFESVHDLHRYMEAELRPDDVVLVKAVGEVDHLERLALVRTDGVLCWRERCGRAIHCSVCRLRRRPASPRD